MPKEADLVRLQREYANRAQRNKHRSLYSWFNSGALFATQQRQRAILRRLARSGFTDLRDVRIFEMGCGGGGVLAELLAAGAAKSNLFGIDLLHDRLVDAVLRLGDLNLAAADGQKLPYPPASFDLVIQFTAFSSVLDDTIKTNIAAEMLRLLKPGGLILWYDFWLNPTNPQTKGIRPKEICALFPGCTYDFRHITLAPPLARRIAPWGWGLALFLESLRVFNSHYLVAIRPVQDG